MSEYQFDYTQSSPVAQRNMYDEQERSAKAEKVLAVLAEHCEPMSPLSDALLLDVSCSTGLMARAFSRRVHRVIGIDIDRAAIAHAQVHNPENNIDYVRMNALQTGFPDDLFDIVVCNQMYEHVPDAGRLLDEIWRILKPGGVCYFGATNRLKVIETHYGRIPFLSYLPKPLAHRYLRLLGKGDRYYETLYTYWGLKRITHRFQVVDYTRAIINEPGKYQALDVLPVGSMAQRLARWVARLAYPLMPGYVWLLIKPVTPRAPP